MKHLDRVEDMEAKGRLVVSVFENAYGETWIAFIERGHLVITGSDVDWLEFDVSNSNHPTLVLNYAEARWVSACRIVWRERG